MLGVTIGSAAHSYLCADAGGEGRGGGEEKQLSLFEGALRYGIQAGLERCCAVMYDVMGCIWIRSNGDLDEIGGH